MRLILRYTGRGSPPAHDVERIQALPGLSLVDATARMLLVEAPESLRPQLEEMPSWVVSEERMIPLPDPRPKIRPS